MKSIWDLWSVAVVGLLFIIFYLSCWVLTFGRGNSILGAIINNVVEDNK